MLSIFRLSEILPLASKRFGPEPCFGGMSYAEVFAKIKDLDPLPARTVVGVLHTDTTPQTLINMLSVLHWDCVYVPIYMSNKDIDQLFLCNIPSCPNCHVPELLPGVEEDDEWSLGLPGFICSECCNRFAQCCPECSVLYSWLNFIKSINVDLILSETQLIKTIDSVAGSNNSIRIWLDLNAATNCELEGCRSVLDKPHKIEENICYQITTSGSTGTAKVVQVPHSCIVPNIIDFNCIFESMTSSDITLLCSPLTFDPSVVEICVTLSAGASLRLMSDADKITPCKLREAILSSSVLMCTPSLISTIEDASAFQNLKILALGGEIFTVELAMWLTGLTGNPDPCPSCKGDGIWKVGAHFSKSPRLFNMYGVTEQSCWSFIFEITEIDPCWPSIPVEGVEVGGVHYQFKGDSELLLGGDRKCVVNNKQAEEWYRPGDIISNTASCKCVERPQHLVVLGRMNTGTFKRNGKVVYRDEIECEVSRRIKGIENKVIIDNERIYIFLITDHDLDEKFIRSQLKLEYKIDYISVVKYQPKLTRHFKLDEKAMVESCHSGIKIVINKENFAKCVTHFFDVRSMELVKDKYFVQQGFDSLDVMMLVNHLFEDLNLPLSRVMLYDVLMRVPVESIYDEVSKELAKESEKPSICETTSEDDFLSHEISCISKSNLSLCVDSSPTVFSHDNKVLVCVGSHAGLLLCAELFTGQDVWKVKLGQSGNRIESKPCYNRGHIFVGCYDHFIYILDVKDGRVLQTIETGAQVKCIPIADVGVVYCGSHDGNLYLMSQTKSKIETSKNILISLPAQQNIISDNKRPLYYCSYIRIDSKPISSCIIHIEEYKKYDPESDTYYDCLKYQIITVTLSGRVVCHSLDDLKFVWILELEVPIFSQPVSHDGSVYIALVEGRVFRVWTECPCHMKAENPLFFSLELNSHVYAGLVVANRILHCGTQNGILFQLTKKMLLGKDSRKEDYEPIKIPVKREKIGEKVSAISLPLIAIRKKSIDKTYIIKVTHGLPLLEYPYLIASTSSGGIFVLTQKNYTELARFQLPAEVFSTPQMVVYDESIYIVVGCRDNNLYFLKFNEKV